MFLLILTAILSFGWISCQVNVPGRPLVVLSAPRRSDSYYQNDFIDIIKFHISYAKAVMGKDNVVVLADRQTIPYLNGSYTSLIPDRLPNEIILESNVQDIWIRDFGMTNQKRPVKLAYLPQSQGKRISSTIEYSFMKFLSDNGITLAKKSRTQTNTATNTLNLSYYNQLIVDGGNIVDNGVDKAILTSRIYEDNQDTGTLVQGLRNALGYNQVVVITQYGTVEEDTTGHSDGMVSFIDTNTLLVGGLEEPKRSRLLQELRNGFGQSVNILELTFIPPEERVRNFDSACGVHVNSLVTNNYIYVPTFGADAQNAQRGISVAVDNQALTVIRSNTRKTVVPVAVPYKVCVLGGSVRCLSMQVEGAVADQLIKKAQQSGRRI